MAYAGDATAKSETIPMPSSTVPQDSVSLMRKIEASRNSKLPARNHNAFHFLNRFHVLLEAKNCRPGYEFGKATKGPELQLS